MAHYIRLSYWKIKTQYKALNWDTLSERNGVTREKLEGQKYYKNRIRYL